MDSDVQMKRKEDIRIVEFLEEDFRNQEDWEEDRERAKAHILRVQEKNRDNLNKKRKPATTYKLGDLVVIKRAQFVNGNKFANKFLGPYRITKVKRNERYDVVEESPNKTSTGAEYLKE